MEKMLVGGMAAFIAVFMVVVLMATFFTVLAVAAAAATIVWLLVAACRAHGKPLAVVEPDYSPQYLRRWNTMRRWEASRDQRQWQELFDSSVR